jgi:hypothetical protein
MSMRRATVALLGVAAMVGAGCGDPKNGGDIVPSTGTGGKTTPPTVPNGSGVPSTSTPGASTTTTGSTGSTGSTGTGTSP